MDTGIFTNSHYFVLSQFIAHCVCGINMAPHSDSKWNGIGFVCSSDVRLQKVLSWKCYHVGQPQVAIYRYNQSREWVKWVTKIGWVTWVTRCRPMTHQFFFNSTAGLIYCGNDNISCQSVMHVQLCMWLTKFQVHVHIQVHASRAVAGTRVNFYYPTACASMGWRPRWPMGDMGRELSGSLGSWVTLSNLFRALAIIASFCSYLLSSPATLPTRWTELSQNRTHSRK